MGCLFSVFHRNSIDKKTISLLNKLIISLIKVIMMLFKDHKERPHQI